MIAAQNRRPPSLLRIRAAALRARRHPRSASGWISWDPTPAKHPWLTPANLTRMRDVSLAIRDEAREIAQRSPEPPQRYAFVGNLANYLYLRAVPLRRRGLDVSIVLHPHDRYVMSHPGWEHFAGSPPDGVRDVDELARLGVQLPPVADVVTFEPRLRAPTSARQVRDFLAENTFARLRDVLRFPGYLAYDEILRFLQDRDALLATQSLYLAYLSARPFLAAQGGGDLWIECSRGDALGELQRLAFGSANAILASNPWTFAHARRFGFRNALYLPLMLDEEDYSPGPPVHRREWEQRTDGSFFVLCTARLDDVYKGSHLALAGFRRLSERRPDARLVLIGWGEHEEESRARLREWGVAHLTLVLPVAGKRRIVDYLRSADVLLDQFSLGAYGATALEAMACGLPVAMRLELDQYAALCETGAPPVLNASAEEEIAANLNSLAESPALLADARAKHRAWFVANHGSSRWAEAYEDMLRATALGHRFSFAGSPLADPLGEDERAYHRDGLLRAPPFAAA